MFCMKNGERVNKLNIPQVHKMGNTESITADKFCSKCGFKLSMLNFMGTCAWENTDDPNYHIYMWWKCDKRAAKRAAEQKKSLINLASSKEHWTVMEVKK